MKTTIYGLFVKESAEQYTCFYIGRTKKSLIDRLMQHLRGFGNSAKKLRMQQAMSEGKEVSIGGLATVEGKGNVEESWWIDFYLSVNAPLTNFMKIGKARQTKQLAALRTPFSDTARNNSSVASAEELNKTLLAI